MQKKFPVAVITAVFVICCSCSGHGDEENTDATSGKTAYEENISEHMTEKTEPDSDDKIGQEQRLLIAIQKDSRVSNYEDNYLTRLLEEDLGVQLDFVYLSSDASDQETALSQMIAGGDPIPDIVIAQNLSQSVSGNDPGIWRKRRLFGPGFLSGGSGHGQILFSDTGRKPGNHD